MSILRRTSRLARLLLPALLLALPSAAEIVAVGEPFPIESDPLDARSGLDVAWLPPGAGADQPAGFLLAWDAEAAAGSAIWRALVPQDTSAPPQPPLLVAGPGNIFMPRVAVGLDRRSAIAFRAGSPLCLGGFLYGPSSETEAALQPTAQPTAAPCNIVTLDAALLPGGRLVVVWDDQTLFTVSDLLGQVFASDGEPVDEPVVLAQTGELLRLREVVPVPDGFLVFFVSASQNRFTPMGPSVLRVQRFDEGGEALAPPVEVRDAPALVEDLSIVPLAGGFVAVWTEWALLSQSPVQFGRDVFARRLDANGAPAGPVVPLLDAALGASFTTAAAAPGPGDTVLLAWLAEAGADALDLRAQLLTADLAPATAAVTLTTRSSAASRLELAAGPAGDALAVWPRTVPSSPSAWSSRASARRPKPSSACKAAASRSASTGRTSRATPAPAAASPSPPTTPVSSGSSIRTTGRCWSRCSTPARSTATSGSSPPPPPTSSTPSPSATSSPTRHGSSATTSATPRGR